jgi:hypothetical protein
MSPREKLQMAYELAFHPAQLNTAWNDWEKVRSEELGVSVNARARVFFLTPLQEKRAVVRKNYQPQVQMS